MLPFPSAMLQSSGPVGIYNSPIQSAMIELPNATATTNHSIPGVVWTPTEAMFVSSMADTVTNPYTGASAQGCIGWASSAVDEESLHFRWDNGHSSTGRVIPPPPVQPIYYNNNRRADPGSWFAGGLSLGQIGTGGGTTTYHMMTLFDGTRVPVVSGVTVLNAGQSIKLNLPFEAKAVITGAGGSMGTLDTLYTNADVMLGFASWDGATIRHASMQGTVPSTTSPRQTIGYLFNNRIGWHRLTLVESDGITLTEIAGQNSHRVMWTAIGGVNAWAGFVNGPTATGTHDFKASSGAPAFTPYFAMSLPNFISSGIFETTSGVDTTGGGFAWGVSQISEASQNCIAWRSTDADGSGGVVEDANTAIPGVAIDVYGHRKLNRLVASHTEFISGGWRGNATVVPTLAQQIPTLLIG